MGTFQDRCRRWARLSLLLGMALPGSMTARGADVLYWTAVAEPERYSVRRGLFDGSVFEDIVQDIPHGVDGLAADAAAGKLYWVERGVTEYRIVRAGLDGKGLEVLHRTPDYPARVALDAVGGALFFTASSRSSGMIGIRRLDLAGGGVDLVIPVEAVDLEVDGERGELYWVQEGPPGTYGTDIWRALIDGREARAIAHHPFDHHATGIALDAAGGKIYWATVDYTNDHLQIVERAALDGSDRELITAANPGLDDWPVYLALDVPAQLLYWVNGEDGSFWRVPMDGGEAQPLFEDPGPFGPFDLVLAPWVEIPLPFRRGDANGDGSLDLADPIATLSTLFLGSGELSCLDAADANDDGDVDIADPVASLTHQFLGGLEIPPPGPADCGEDPAPDDALGCRDYERCDP